MNKIAPQQVKQYDAFQRTMTVHNRIVAGEKPVGISIRSQWHTLFGEADAAKVVAAHHIIIFDNQMNAVIQANRKISFCANGHHVIGRFPMAGNNAVLLPGPGLHDQGPGRTQLIPHAGFPGRRL